ncbi:hypothetical protein ZIOFF_049993 [Zingiber officinale]|uniref:Crossover junction endonuclease MUS81 n=1 Tax=Zingiber officinale TaxID=94328 RepID=A0A8J5FJQ2_ZINOF|nr:hypothetical protein ZIOFF_049993 [Zingiber officinale]
MEGRHPVRCSENEELTLYLRRKRQEKADSGSISDNLDSTLSVAYRNICNAKTPIRTLKDLSSIKGVGKWILRLMQGFFQESAADEPSAKNDAPRNGKKAKEPKRYIPQKNSAAYALLITLYRAMQNGASFMKKQELIDASEASGLSRTSIATDKSKQPGSFGSSRDWYTGWSCMKTLISRGLVVKSSCPAKFMLTQEGQEAAKECLIRSGNLQSMSENNICHSISDAQSSPVVKLTPQLSSTSCQQEVIDISNEVADKGLQADLSDYSVDYTVQGKQCRSTFISMPNVQDIMTTIPEANTASQIPVCFDVTQSFNLRVCTAVDPYSHKASANDVIKGNDNILAMPPHDFGEKFRDIYDVILILDDRENFGCFTTEILEGFDVQRTSGFSDTVRRYGYLTKSIIEYYDEQFCIGKVRHSGVCSSYKEFISKCQDLEKMTVSDVFALQLMQVPQVTEEIALAVVGLYSTVLSLAQAYSQLEGDLHAQEEMLKNKSRVVSTLASRNIFKLVWGG